MSEWVKCTDRLPDDERRVLIVVEHRFTNAPWEQTIYLATFRTELEVSIHGCVIRRRRSWLVSGGGCCEPEYWMELPAPPPLVYGGEPK